MIGDSLGAQEFLPNLNSENMTKSWLICGAGIMKTDINEQL